MQRRAKTINKGDAVPRPLNSPADKVEVEKTFADLRARFATRRSSRPATLLSPDTTHLDPEPIVDGGPPQHPRRTITREEFSAMLLETIARINRE